MLFTQILYQVVHLNEIYGIKQFLVRVQLQHIHLITLALLKNLLHLMMERIYLDVLVPEVVIEIMVRPMLDMVPM